MVNFRAVVAIEHYPILEVVPPAMQRGCRLWPPNVAETVTKPAAGPLENRSPGGCTIDMFQSNCYRQDARIVFTARYLVYSNDYIGADNQSMNQRHRMVNGGGKFRFRRDVREMSPQNGMLYGDDNNVDDSTLVNRLQDKV